MSLTYLCWTSIPYMDKADLHVHTNSSDGIYPPEEIIDIAQKAHLKAIAITDHDTVDALPQALEYASRKQIEVIPGIELSTEHKEKEFHILGYFIDYRDTFLLKQLAQIQEIRRERIFRICDKLTELGKPLKAEEVLCISKNSSSLGRLHVAQALIAKGYVASLKEAFETFLSSKNSAYVKKTKISAEAAIQLIIRIGGLAVLAHPHLNNHRDYIPDLVKSGLAGIEVYYPDYTEQQIEKLQALARHYNLFITGGSDFHGSSTKQVSLGQRYVPYSTVEEMKQKCIK